MPTISNRLAVLATCLAAGAALAGLAVPGLYVDAPNWVQQAQGTDLATLQRLLGHESVTTTMHYVHVARSHVTAQGSPLESLPDVSAAG